MFEDSLVESSGRLTWGNPWTTAFSFAVQSAIGATIVLLSLAYTDVLPMHNLISTLEAPPPAQAAAVTQVMTVARQTSEFSHGVLIPPREIPSSIPRVQDEQPGSESNSQPSIGVPGGFGAAPPDSALADVLRPAATLPPPAVVQRPRLSTGVAEGMLIRQVKPPYPPLALQARVQGTVVLQAVIGKDGRVEELRLISGPPLLAKAAIDAVKLWIYRPYLLNGEAVAVDTQVIVNFRLTE